MWCECTPAVAFGVALLGQQLGRRGRAAVVVLSLMCVLWTVALLRAYVHGWVPAEQPQSLEFTYRECVEAVLHP